MWNLSFNCQLCPCSWSHLPLQTGLLTSIEMPAQFCRISASFYVVFVLCGTALNTAACLSFSPLCCLLAFILLFVSPTVLFIYLHSLCALSQGCEQRLSAGNSLCHHVIVKRAPIQSQGSVFFKGKTMLATTSCLYSTVYKQCPLWHNSISCCLWQSTNQGREKLQQRRRLEPVERESEQGGQMPKAMGHGKTS